MKKALAIALTAALVASFAAVGALAVEAGENGMRSGAAPGAAQELTLPDGQRQFGRFPGSQQGEQPGQPGAQQGEQFGQQGGQFGQQPGTQQNGALQSAEYPTEIVAGTTDNSAAALSEDLAGAVNVTLSERYGTLNIERAGTYIVTGTCSDGGITVKKGVTGVVLVLRDLDLASSTGAALSVNKEAEAKIIISGSVTLTDNEDPADESSEDAAVADAYDGAAIKIKAGASVYVTGDGTLTVNGNAKNGIKAGDGASLILDGATVNITAANDAINANDDLAILSGTLTITAGDDAVHADRILTIGSADGGPVLNVRSASEGLEGTVVNILGGEITLNTSDDAINAANADAAFEGELDYAVNMTGGSVSITSRGDGIDSNGSINLIGGSATIRSASMGGEAGIDYDGQFYLSEDFVLQNASGVAGPDGMPGQPGEMGGQPGEMNGQPPQMGGQPGEMGGQPPQMVGPMGQMPGGCGPMGGMQTPGQLPAMFDGQSA